jgi:hypothetical protein
MRFYTKEHLFYCGVDLHARSMYVCILDQHGQIVLHRNMPSDPDAFLDAIRTEKTSSYVPSVCSPGTGSQISVIDRPSLLSSVMHYT